MSPQKLTVDEVSLPVGAALLNRWKNTLHRLGWSKRPLEVQSLLREAEAESGLEARGSAQSFDRGLEQLLDSAQSEVQLKPFGRTFLHQDCRTVLVDQLLVEALFQRHP